MAAVERVQRAYPPAVSAPMGSMALGCRVPKKKLSPRAERRAHAREAEKAARDRERLARIEAGGSPERPAVVESASQVEPHALAAACLRCGGRNRLDDHAAVAVDDWRLRVVRMTCVRCGAARAIWFRLAPTLPS